MRSEQGRLLSLDYGSATVGVAVCDPFRIAVRGIEIIRRDRENHLRQTIRRIVFLAEEQEAVGIVLGLPLNMDGSAGERVRKTEEFRDLLVRKTGLPVYLQDERLTSVEAEEIMRDRGIPARDFKKYVDMIAAEIILSDYLNMDA